MSSGFETAAAQQSMRQLEQFCSIDSERHTSRKRLMPVKSCIGKTNPSTKSTCTAKEPGSSPVIKEWLERLCDAQTARVFNAFERKTPEECALSRERSCAPA